MLFFARPIAAITLALVLTTQAAAQAPAAGDADALFEAEDWAGAAAAYDALLAAAEDPGQLSPRAAARAAIAHLRLGRRDEAFIWLARGANLGLPLGFFDNHPAVAEARDDPRFAAVREVAERQSLPCRHQPVYRQFDFWIGTWEVYAGENKAGINTIERRSEGCMLYESWQSASGGSGHSINYVDPSTGEWVQVWMGSDGTPISGRGGLVDGAMRLVGEHVLKTGQRRPFRMTFTPQDDGSVRQYLEESTDGGETFSVWFDGRYVAAGSQPAESE